jgi:hypothetical protein
MNRLTFDLKQQYQDRIEDLQQKKEILKLQEQIKLLSYDKYYDC